MPASILLTLDTTGPGGVAVVIDGGAAVSADFDVAVAIASTDADLSGYQVKLYGDVDDAFAPGSYRALEADAPWITLASPHTVRLAPGEGSKTVRVKVRDDVHNVSAEASDTITVDTSIPVVTVNSGPTAERISKQAGERTSSFTWQSDVAISAYKVKLVPATNSVHTAGTEINNANGSVNVSGGDLAAATPVTTDIDGADLEAAGADGSGDVQSVVKVFVQEAGSGNWSAGS